MDAKDIIGRNGTMAKKKTKHVNYVDLVRLMASQSWGQKCPDTKEASKKLSQELLSNIDVSGAALLEIVRRLNQFFNALGAASRPLDDDDDGEVPEWAKKFPKAKVGTVLYDCDNGLEHGVGESAVVEVCDYGYVKISRGYKPQYASDSAFETVAEALEREANSDIKYHKQRLAWAEAALAAVKDGGDLTKFVEGIPEA